MLRRRSPLRRRGPLRRISPLRRRGPLRRISPLRRRSPFRGGSDLDLFMSVADPELLELDELLRREEEELLLLELDELLRREEEELPPLPSVELNEWYEEEELLSPVELLRREEERRDELLRSPSMDDITNELPLEVMFEFVMPLSFTEFMEARLVNKNFKMVVDNILGSPELLKRKLMNIERDELIRLFIKSQSSSPRNPTQENILVAVQYVINEKKISEPEVEWIKWRKKRRFPDLSIVFGQMPFGQTNFTLPEIKLGNVYYYESSNYKGGGIVAHGNFTVSDISYYSNSDTFRMTMTDNSTHRYIQFKYNLPGTYDVVEGGERVGWSASYSFNYIEKFVLVSKVEDAI